MDDAKSARQKEKTSEKAPLYALSRPSRCYGCDRRLLEDEIVKLEGSAIDQEVREVFCMKCSGLESEFQLLKKGDARLTRLAKKHSKITFIVLKWSDTWKCYERQGLFVEKSALDAAKKLADTP